MEALARIQERREQWQHLLQQVPEDKQNEMLARSFGVGKGIVDIEQSLE